MKLTIGTCDNENQWSAQFLDLPLETVLTPRLALDALNAVFPGVRYGIVWHGLVGYRIYHATWKRVNRYKTNGPVNDYVDYRQQAKLLKANKAAVGSKGKS